MDRFTNKRILLGKIQTVHSTDPVPTPADNAILVYDLDVKPLVFEKKERRPIRSYFGTKAALLASQHMEISFKVDFAGSGAAGTAPVWGPLVRACACAELVTAGVKVEYTPIIDSMEEITFYYHADGALHKLIDCKGEASVRLVSNDWPQLVFSFVGRKGGRVVTANPASPVFTSWIDPLLVNDTNTGDVTLGATSYPSKGLEFSFGNQVAFKPLLGKETVRITDRNPSGRISLDVTPTQELALLAIIEASTTQTLLLTHGVTAGSIVEASAPALQLLEPTDEDDGGDLLHGYGFELKPSSGNDEFKLTAR
jgi:hypothetical protein